MSLDEFKSELFLGVFDIFHKLTSRKQMSFFIPIPLSNNTIVIIKLRETGWSLYERSPSKNQSTWFFNTLPAQDKARIQYLAKKIIEADNAENLWLVVEKKLKYMPKGFGIFTKLCPLSEAWKQVLKKFPQSALKEWDKQHLKTILDYLLAKIEMLIAEIKQLRENYRIAQEGKNKVEKLLRDTTQNLEGFESLKSNYGNLVKIDAINANKISEQETEINYLKAHIETITQSYSEENRQIQEKHVELIKKYQLLDDKFVSFLTTVQVNFTEEAPLSESTITKTEDDNTIIKSQNEEYARLIAFRLRRTSRINSLETVPQNTSHSYSPL